MTSPKVVQTWASVMASHLSRAAEIAHGPALTDPAACARLAELLRESAELLQCIAQHHRDVAARAIVTAGAVQMAVAS